MNLDTLEKMADVSEQLRCDYVKNISPATIKSLIALVRMQHEALKKYEQQQSYDDLELAEYAGEAALAAYGRFNKGE